MTKLTTFNRSEYNVLPEIQIKKRFKFTSEILLIGNILDIDKVHTKNETVLVRFLRKISYSFYIKFLRTNLVG